MNFKRTIQTLKFTLTNQSVRAQKSGENQRLQKMFMGSPIKFNYQNNMIFSPEIIYWDENRKLGFYEVISKIII